MSKFFSKQPPVRIKTVQDAVSLYRWLSDAYTSKKPVHPARLRRVTKLAIHAAERLKQEAAEIEIAVAALVRENNSTDRV